MKKIMIMLMMLVMILSMAACGDQGGASGKIPDGDDETVIVPPENEPEEDEEFVKMYELTNIEYVMDNGETQQGDFIPGAEVYIFTETGDSRSFEYKYKNYPTEEDMLNDSNYSIESVFGTYTLNSDMTQLALLGQDGSIRQAEVSGDKIIFEYSQEGYSAKMVVTYTETDAVDF